MSQRSPFADTATIRAALFDVIDAGDKDGQAWTFAQNESDDESERRHQFADAVIRAIEDLQSNFKFVRLENFCPRHQRALLPVPTAKTCAPCQQETASQPSRKGEGD